MSIFNDDNNKHKNTLLACDVTHLALARNKSLFGSLPSVSSNVSTVSVQRSITVGSISSVGADVDGSVPLPVYDCCN